MVFFQGRDSGEISFSSSETKKHFSIKKLTYLKNHGVGKTLFPRPD